VQANASIDEAKQDLYFPAHRGFKYRFGVHAVAWCRCPAAVGGMTRRCPWRCLLFFFFVFFFFFLCCCCPCDAGSKGVYIGLHDFWIDYVTGNLHLSVQHGQRSQLCVRGQNQVHVHSPSIVLSIRDLQLKLRVDGFSLVGDKGTKVPDLKVCPCVSVSVRVSACVWVRKFVARAPYYFRLWKLLHIPSPVLIYPSVCSRAWRHRLQCRVCAGSTARYYPAARVRGTLPCRGALCGSSPRVIVDTASAQIRIEWNFRNSAWTVLDGFRFEVVHLDRQQQGSIKVWR
jgi:hypothetical protein